MTTNFLPEEIYAKAFPVGPIEREELRKYASSLWTGFDFITDASRNPINVVSIGYGSGLRDFPVLLALNDALRERTLKKKGKRRRIIIHAIEPNWNKQIEKADGKLRWEKRSNLEGIKYKVLKGKNITIKLYKSTVEAWQQNSPISGRAKAWDVVMACSVIHLLDDWKATIAYFIEQLKPGGALILSETLGSFNLFDGYFRDPPNSDDMWDSTCRKIFEKRDSLLLPATKIVAPRDLGFLKKCLKLAGFSAPREVDFPVRESYITREDFARVIRSTQDGPDAHTFGALRIFDKPRAEAFVTNSIKVLDAVSENNLKYTFGFRFYSYRKPVKEIHFLPNIAICSHHNSMIESIECKSTVKRALANRIDDSNAHKEAVAAILFNLREALALSRDTMVVATTKRDGKYFSSVQMLPLSLVGSSKHRLRLSRDFMNRFSVYLSATSDSHLSHIFDTHIGDLSIEVVVFDQLPFDKHQAVSFRTGYSADGNLNHIQMCVQRKLILDFKKAFEHNLRSLLKLQTEGQLAPNAFHGWNYENGLMRFFVVGEPDQIRNSLYNSIPTLERTLTQIENDFDAYRNYLRVLIKDELKNRPLPAAYFNDELVNALSNIVRLAMLKWQDTSAGLPWKSCIYIMRKTMGQVGSTGVGVLLLLSETDYDTWRDVNASPSNLPLLVASVEPFLSAIQEIESTALLLNEGEKIGEVKEQTAFAHQTASMINSLVHEVELLPEKIRTGIGATLLAKLYLLRTTINSYRSKEMRLNAGDFPYPWQDVENPLAVYRDIGIQLGLARCLDASYEEDAVRQTGRASFHYTKQIGQPGFDSYRRLFDTLPLCPASMRPHLIHSHFAVLIVLIMKQAVYHTIRSILYPVKTNKCGSEPKIIIDIHQESTELILECSVINPAVTAEDEHFRPKDVSELNDLAERLSNIDSHNYRYSIEGPVYRKHDHCWKTTTRIHQLEE